MSFRQRKGTGISSSFPRLIPVRDKSEVIGMRVVRVRSNGLLAKLGLKRGEARGDAVLPVQNRQFAKIRSA